MTNKLFPLGILVKGFREVFIGQSDHVSVIGLNDATKAVLVDVFQHGDGSAPPPVADYHPLPDGRNHRLEVGLVQLDLGSRVKHGDYCGELVAHVANVALLLVVLVTEVERDMKGKKSENLGNKIGSTGCK